MVKRFIVMVLLIVGTVTMLGKNAKAADPGVPNQLQTIEQQLQAIQNAINSGVSCKPQSYYLTKGVSDGAGAPTACASGFHMANLFEIFDTTNLMYDTTRGATLADSGSGPPNSTFGWIRTGGAANSSSGNAGEDNCAAYTTNSSSASGTIVHPSGFWTGSSNPVSPWDAEESPCNNMFAVWCVQNR